MKYRIIEKQNADGNILYQTQARFFPFIWVMFKTHSSLEDAKRTLNFLNRYDAVGYKTTKIIE
jgi:hypothetical protein